MNDLEEKLYVKGLENLYGSILLDEDCALDRIENLVYLTRELTVLTLSRVSVMEEVAFVRGFCTACWPDAQFDIQMEGAVATQKVVRRCLSEPICCQLLKLERHGKIPEKLVVWKEKEIVHYCLKSDGCVCAQGVAADE